ncbi:MAG: hypothetical protein WC453_01960 [Patescibacteria group bacterium]
MSENNKPRLTASFANLETAIKIWWKNLKKFVLVYLWALAYAAAPLVIAAVMLGLLVWLGDGAGAAVYTAIFAVLALCFLAFLYFAIRAYIAIFLVVKHDFSGNEHEIFKESAQYFWSYLGVAIPVAIFVLLWSLLLIIPGIIFGVFYSFAVYIFFFEGKKGLDAISASKRLVSGYWWPVFGRFLFIGIIAIVFSLIITAPLSAKGVSPESGFYHIWNMLVQIVNYLIGPIYLLYNYQIYRDLVKIKK